MTHISGSIRMESVHTAGLQRERDHQHQVEVHHMMTVSESSLGRWSLWHGASCGAITWKLGIIRRKGLHWLQMAASYFFIWVWNYAHTHTFTGVRSEAQSRVVLPVLSAYIIFYSAPLMRINFLSTIIAFAIRVHYLILPSRGAIRKQIKHCGLQRK